MERVCAKTGLTPEQIRSETKFVDILRPRQICHYLGKNRTKKSLNDVGAYFGNKDHATVLNSSKRIQNFIDTEKEFRDYWNDILND